MQNNNKHQKLPLVPELIANENVYENVWLATGDNKEIDILRLLQQNRLSK